MDYQRCVPPASVILGFLLPVCVWGQGTSAGRPVPAELVRDGELVVESSNFAIATPVGQWQWSFIEDHSPPAQETYICTEDESGAMFSVAVMHTRFPPGDRFVAEFQKGLQKSLAATGWTVASMEMVESSVPVPDSSYRCQWHASRPEGTPVYGYAYVVAGEASYTLTHATPKNSEPPEFTAFASTFRLLKGPRPSGEPSLMVMLYILAVGIPCAVAATVNRARGRMIVNGGTVSMALVVLVTVIAIAIEGYAGIAGGLPPEQFGPIAGYRVGQGLLPLLAALLAWYLFRRSKARGKMR